MARKAERITLSDGQRNELLSLTQEGNDDVALRARIILACEEEQESKKVADALCVSPANVAKWRKRFMESGVQGIRDSKSVGHPVSPDKTGPTPEEVSAYISDHPDTWNVANVSSYFSTTESVIYRILKKLDIAPNQRTRSWTYTTSDTLGGNHAVLGLFLSTAVQIMVIGEMDEAFHNDIVHGELETSNSVLYKYLCSSETTLTMADTIVSFTQQPEAVSHSQGQSPKLFLNEVLKSWETGSVRSIHVFACNASLAHDHHTGTQTVFHQADSYSDWIGQIFIWASEKMCDAEKNVNETILDILGKYWKSQAERIEPYHWKLLPGREKATPDKNRPSQGKEPLPVAASFPEIETVLESRLEETKDGQAGTRLLSQMLFQYEDGTVSRQIIESDDLLLSAEEFDFFSGKAFEEGIDRLDQVMSNFARKIDLKGREQYLEDVKKNKNR